MYNSVLNKFNIDYLLVCSTNQYLVEYPSLKENARYTLTGFSGSTGDALLTKDGIYLFVDGRYHTQADNEANKGVTVVKLKIGQKQDDEIKKLVEPQKVMGIVAKKISQKRLESFSEYNIKLLEDDPINNYTEEHSLNDVIQVGKPIFYKPAMPTFVTNLEEVSYLTAKRDFSKDCSSKIWSKLFINTDGSQKIFNDDKECSEFLRSFDGEIIVDKSKINAFDYALIKSPINKTSEISMMKSIKSNSELEAYKKAFEATDKTMMAIRNYIENNSNLSEYDIAKRLREEFINFGAKSLSFNSIVAINQNSALAHYSKNSKDVFLTEGSLVLIDCGAYYAEGLATDITRVFVKGEPNELQKEVYTTVLKAFLNSYNYISNTSFLKQKTTEDDVFSVKRENGLITGFEIDTLAHSILDDKIEGFVFGHGLGHGIGINVHEAPPNLSQNEIAKAKILDGMTFTIEPGLYNANHFGIRLENSCFMQNGKIHSFVKMGYEGKLINYNMLSEQEIEWLKGFVIL